MKKKDKKKTFSIIILSFFMLSMVSCYSIKIENIETTLERNFNNVRVLGITDLSGNWIYFAKPGKITKDAVSGKVMRADGTLEFITVPVTGIRQVKARITKPTLTGVLILGVVVFGPVILFIIGANVSGAF